VFASSKLARLFNLKHNLILLDKWMSIVLALSGFNLMIDRSLVAASESEIGK
jgi:hypothetical protein